MPHRRFPSSLPSSVRNVQARLVELRYSLPATFCAVDDTWVRRMPTSTGSVACYAVRTGAELPATVVAPGPEPSGRVDAVAGVAARAHRDERDALRDVDLHRDLGAGQGADAELASIVVPPGPGVPILQDGDGLSVLRPTPALEDLRTGPGRSTLTGMALLAVEPLPSCPAALYPQL